MKNGALLSTVAALTIAFTSGGQAAIQPAVHPTAAPQAHAEQTQAKPVSKVAPLDEYFGKMKLSPLGINNTIHDTNLHVNYDKANAGHYYQALAWAEDALKDWAHKYPQDTWLPGRAYYMSHVFWEMHTAEATAAAENCRMLLFKQFPKSRWAAMAKHETQATVAPLDASTASAQAPAADSPAPAAGAANDPKATPKP
jgi:TolA-binding protein